MATQHQHQVVTIGYTHPPCFDTLKEARAHLKALVAESYSKARARSKTATKHKLAEDDYEITLGRDKRSARWNRHIIISNIAP